MCPHCFLKSTSPSLFLSLLVASASAIFIPQNGSQIEFIHLPMPKDSTFFQKSAHPFQISHSPQGLYSWHPPFVSFFLSCFFQVHAVFLSSKCVLLLKVMVFIGIDACPLIFLPHRRSFHVGFLIVYIVFECMMNLCNQFGFDFFFLICLLIV